MMASNLLSRFLPPTAETTSVYQTLREGDESSESTDIEERAGMAIDEENLQQDDFQLDPALADAMGSQLGLGPPSRKSKAAGKQHSRERGQIWDHSRRRVDAEDADDDVPMSLLVEMNQRPGSVSPQPGMAKPQPQSPNATPIPGHATGAARAKWQTTQEQQQLHRDTPTKLHFGAQRTQRGPLLLIDPKQKALWRWTNVQNLDNFLKDVYDYFIGNGIWCILLGRMLNLLTLGFVVGFGTFLTSCIQYSELRNANKLADIRIKHCTQKMSGLSNALIWIFAFLWVAKLFQYLYDIRRLKRMHDFYLYLLEVPDTDIQTVSWQDVVKRLMALRDSNPTTSGKISEQGRRYIKSQSKQRMDAHDIANRLMRRDNYLIALFNKDILDVTLPVPFLANRQFFSKTLEWNLSFCILDYVFNEKGQVRPVFLKESQRRILSDGLRRRFLFAGIMNVICAPFIIIYLVLLYFFRYFSEYQKNPSQIGSRQYTPLAEWKFREFNELWHLFERRINMSYPFASRYLDQFPKDKLVQIARFIAFVTGALISVLALASVFDPDLFLGFEISPDRTVLFYLTLFTSIWAAVRAIIPEENLVFDPEYALNNVIDYTHYCPAPWRGRLHSDEVRKEFARLYRMKLIIFLGEVFSIITTPFVLWFSLPNCSDQLVDFFREFTVHVDGLGYVCSFAVFDFQKGGNNVAQQPQPPRGTEGQDLRDEYYSARDGKMLASYYNFLDNYATNPKAGAPYHRPPRKAQFHPPPVFPGLQSTNLTVDGHPSGAGGRSENWDRHQRISSRHGFGGPASASQRTPRFPPVASQPSPITSILLDPQHQPAVSSIRAAHRPGIQSRLRASRRPPTDVIEDDEDAFVEQDISNTSRGGPADSFLDDSWKTTRPDANDEDDEADGGVPTNAADKSPGVLGLVYQFSKAQTEGRGAGVHI